MPIEDLFNATICCSCGLCCSKDYLCEKCEVATLLANGLPESYVNEIHGLRYTSPNHGNRFEFSKLYCKLQEIGRTLNPISNE